MELENLKTRFLGRKFTYFKQIDSTQLEIFRKIENNTIANGEIVFADIQTQGKRDTWQKMVYN